MTTMIVSIENNADAGNLACEMRQLKGVTEVKVQKETETEYIPGLPYTYEERMTDISKSEENYAKGLTSTLEELKKRVVAW